MAAPLTIRLNGSDRTFNDLGEHPTIGALVASLGLRPDRVALEQNGDIVPRSTWDGSNLNEGDQIELVHFVGGGIN
jgi:thiamine biosynthesis protein ThiS